MIQELAELFIETVVGVKSQSTIYDEHLYELDGFKGSLSAVLIEEVLKGNNRQVKAEEIGLHLRIGLIGKESYPALNHLKVHDAQMNKGTLQMILISDDQIIQCWLGLDFRNERLMFWPAEGVKVSDDGSKNAEEKISSALQFQKDLFLNGALEILDEDNGNVYGYSVACIPQNIDLTATVESFDEGINYFSKASNERS